MDRPSFISTDQVFKILPHILHVCGKGNLLNLLEVQEINRASEDGEHTWQNNQLKYIPNFLVFLVHPLQLFLEIVPVSLIFIPSPS